MTDTDDTPTLDDATLAEIRARVDWDAPEYGLTVADVLALLAEVERLRTEVVPWREHRQALVREAIESTARAEAAEAAIERARSVYLAAVNAGLMVQPTALRDALDAPARPTPARED